MRTIRSQPAAWSIFNDQTWVKILAVYGDGDAQRQERDMLVRRTYSLVVYTPLQPTLRPVLLALVLVRLLAEEVAPTINGALSLPVQPKVNLVPHLTSRTIMKSTSSSSSFTSVPPHSLMAFFTLGPCASPRARNLRPLNSEEAGDPDAAPSTGTAFSFSPSSTAGSRDGPARAGPSDGCARKDDCAATAVVVVRLNGCLGPVSPLLCPTGANEFARLNDDSASALCVFPTLRSSSSSVRPAPAFARVGDASLSTGCVSRVLVGLRTRRPACTSKPRPLSRFPQMASISAGTRRAEPISSASFLAAARRSVELLRSY